MLLDNAGRRARAPATAGRSWRCAVVVTSRDTLAGLVAGMGATRLDVDLLPLADAVALLRALIGRRPVDVDPAATEMLAAQCSLLPLALRVAAELAVARPGVPLADLVRELDDQQRRLGPLEASGGPARRGTRGVFSWSYRTWTRPRPGLPAARPAPGLRIWESVCGRRPGWLTTCWAHAGQMLGDWPGGHLVELWAGGAVSACMTCCAPTRPDRPLTRRARRRHVPRWSECATCN